jgi:hypothetical protein
MSESSSLVISSVVVSGFGVCVFFCVFTGGVSLGVFAITASGGVWVSSFFISLLTVGMTGAGFEKQAVRRSGNTSKVSIFIVFFILSEYSFFRGNSTFRFSYGKKILHNCPFLYNRSVRALVAQLEEYRSSKPRVASSNLAECTISKYSKRPITTHFVSLSPRLLGVKLVPGRKFEPCRVHHFFAKRKNSTRKSKRAEYHLINLGLSWIFY